MVVSVLLLLTVLAVATLWESDFMFFSRHRYDAMQRAHIESGFTLYQQYPDRVVETLAPDTTILLYDSIPHSRIKFSRRQWGLYEVVTLSGHDGSLHGSKMIGASTAYKDDILFWYRDNNSALTITGKSHFKGNVRIPRSGVVYGQMGSVFFNGEKIEPAVMKESDTALPRPQQNALDAIKELHKLRGGSYDYLPVDSIKRSFYQRGTGIYTAEGLLELCYLDGNVILVGEKIEIDESCRISDIIIVAGEIRIGEGFTGSLQAFATDSLHVGNKVTLLYPSGLYSEKYIGIGDNTEVNGYAIVNLNGTPSVRNANYKQSRYSTLRGLVYVSGIAQFQGIVSGSVFLDKAVYFSPRGYYENMLNDATVLPNAEMACPFWLESLSGRKEVKWLY